MALSKELEDELTCPIDLEFYVEPMSLKCMHTLCKKDVDYMIDSDGLLLCPQCKKLSQRCDIKHDFRTQRLLDLHTADKHRLKKQTVCDNCEDEIASCWCEQCQAYFGERCTKGHMKIKTSKHHRLITVSSIVEENKATINNSLTKMDDISKQLNVLTENLSSGVSDIDRVLDQGYDKLKASEDRLISAVHEVYDRLRKSLNLRMAERKQVLNDTIGDWQTRQTDFDKDMNLLKDCLSENDTKTLLDKEFVDNLTKFSTQKCEALATELQKAKIPNTSNVGISLSKNDTVLDEIEKLTIEIIGKTVTQANVPRVVPNQTKAKGKPVETASTSSRPEKTALESPTQAEAMPPAAPLTTPLSLEDYTKQGIKVHPLPYMQSLGSNRVHHMAIINDSIWLIMENTKIYIANINENDTLSFEKSFLIRDDNEEYETYKVIRAPNKKAVAKCAKNRKGSALYEVDDTGQVLAVVARQNYLDIAADDSFVYGLKRRFPKCEIDVHQCEGSAWRLVHTVTLSTECHSLYADNQLITLASGLDVIRRDLRTHKESTVHDFRHVMYVVTGDRRGNVLLTHTTRDHIQTPTVLFRDDKRKEITVDVGRNVRVDSAAIDKQGRLLVLLDDGSICCLTPESA